MQISNNDGIVEVARKIASTLLVGLKLFSICEEVKKMFIRWQWILTTLPQTYVFGNVQRKTKVEGRK